MHLESLGWNAAFAAGFHPHADAGRLAARVALQHKHAYQLLTRIGPIDGFCTGRLLHDAADASQLPVVGDWVAVTPRAGELVADIHAVLPRRSAFARRGAGPREEGQILAANIDTVFLVMALDANFNLRRLERLLALTWESGAAPVVVLNKLDLATDPAAAMRQASDAAPGAEVLAISALHSTGCDKLVPHLLPGRTVAVLGSSGVGKSTLVNALLGEERQRTGARREDNSLGRHTTVHRELLPLPGGALIIDTPGLREVGMWHAEEGLDSTFRDIAQAAQRCRFRDCTHQGEPGCGVQAALDAGEIEHARYAAWLKLAREQAWLDRRGNKSSEANSKRVYKARTMATRRRQRLLGED